MHSGENQYPDRIPNSPNHLGRNIHFALIQTINCGEIRKVVCIISPLAWFTTIFMETPPPSPHAFDIFRSLHSGNLLLQHSFKLPCGMALAREVPKPDPIDPRICRLLEAVWLRSHRFGMNCLVKMESNFPFTKISHCNNR